MIQTMTGPRGIIAYFHGAPQQGSSFPKLNTPCCAFARYGGFAHNGNHAPSVTPMPRRRHSNAAIDLFGYPRPRLNG